MLTPATSLLAAALAASPLSLQAPSVPAGTKLTPSASSAQVGLMFGLQMRDPQVLDELIARQQDPHSSLYRHWITPEEFANRFGLSAADYRAVVAQLNAAGFKVDTYADRMVVRATGTVAQAERLLGLSFYDVSGDEAAFRTFRGNLRLAGPLAASVIGIVGLDTRARFHPRYVDSFGDYTMGPQDLRRWYDMSPLHDVGITGRLSAVGVLGPIPDDADFPDVANLQWFYTNVSDSSVQFDLVNLGLQGNPTDNQGDKDELELDAEMSTVAAPLEQSITMVLAPADELFIAGYAAFVNQYPGLTAVSTSYGTCEPAEIQGEAMSTGIEAMEHVIDANLIAQGTAEGIAFFAASGDDGADDCQDGSGAAVDFPASIPYMVAVGGTQYAGTQLGTLSYLTDYSPGDEVVWGNAPNGGAGGGGTSILFRKPSYQKGIGDSSSFRDLPDIALTASPNPGVAVDLSAPGTMEPIGGTSDAAPMAAGIFALLNDAIGGCRIGAPHFELYKLGVAQYDAGGTAVFHDITSGNISQGGVDIDAGAPQAGVGFDDCSGWGSLDVANLAGAWPVCPATGSPSGPAFFPDGGLPLDDAGYYDPGPFTPGAFDGGADFDAGREPYDPCAVIACDGGAVCVPSDAGGPYACVTFCTPTQSPSPCAAGTFCDATSGTCVFGCIVQGDCPSKTTCVGADPDAGQAGACDQDCQTDWPDGGPVADAGCPTGTFCRSSTGTCGTACEENADCGAGRACETCFGRCTTDRDGGAIGDPCTSRANCGTGETCLGTLEGFTDAGYCSSRCEANVGICGCPSGNVCLQDIYNPDAGVGGFFDFCLVQCVIGDDSTCSFGNVCDAIGLGSTPGSVGGCLPKCTCGFPDGGGECDSVCNTDPAQTACDPVSGDCVIPFTDGGAPHTAASSASSSGSSGSAAASTASSSSGGTHGSSSTGTAGSSGHGTTTAGSTGSAASSGSTAASSGTSGAAGTSSGSTHGAAAAGSTTGGSSSAGAKKGGCGCGSGSDPLGVTGLLLALAALSRRRRRE